MPGAAFCSWINNGRRSTQAATPPGPLTYPPAPSTERGRTRRSTASASSTAFMTRSGAKTHAAAPLPRMPATLTHSIGKPFAGTKRDSMLPGTPNHTTPTPRWRSTCATASAGKICPPVPPAMINTGPGGGLPADAVLIACLPVCA